MSLIKIYIHAVFCTKKRERVLTRPERYEIFKHIEQNAEDKGIQIEEINGHVDHVHVLLSMTSEQSIAEIMQLVKGECAFWVNHKRRCYKKKLIWAGGYYAASVSKKDLDKVRKYIKNQETHHADKTFEEECWEMIEHYGFDRILGDDEPDPMV